MKNVTVKKDHICAGCGFTIHKGNRATTIDNKKYGRSWYCFEPDCQSYALFGMSVDEYAETCALGIGQD